MTNNRISVYRHAVSLWGHIETDTDYFSDQGYLGTPAELIGRVFGRLWQVVR